MLTKILLLLTFTLFLFSQNDQNFEIPKEFDFISRMEFNPDSVLDIISKSQIILERNNNYPALADLYFNIASYYSSIGVYDKATSYYNLILESENLLFDSEFEVKVLNKTGDVFK